MFWSGDQGRPGRLNLQVLQQFQKLLVVAAMYLPPGHRLPAGSNGENHPVFSESKWKITPCSSMFKRVFNGLKQAYVPLCFDKSSESVAGLILDPLHQSLYLSACCSHEPRNKHININTLWWTNIAMENHNFSWENPLFLWPFSIAFC